MSTSAAIEQPAQSGLTLALAREAAGTGYATLSDESRALVRQCVLDYIGVTLAGARDNVSNAVLAEMIDMGGTPEATVFGRGVRLPALSAALVNGTFSHALDFDDVNMSMPGHVSVVVLPGLLALGEARKASGKAIIEAFVSGYELACKTGTSVAPGHYRATGFHATGTVGALGSAASAGRLLGLSPVEIATAIGVAATQASGLKSLFGTDCKPFHAGKAAQNGLLAARLVSRGFTARADAIECHQGFAATHSPDFDAALAFEPPVGGGLHLRNNLFKYHAACYLTHAGIEACRQLKHAHNLVPDRIKRVVLRLDASVDRICNIPSPVTGLEAKFSLRQTAAMALGGIDTSGLTSYSAATANDPRLMALRDKVEIDFVEGWSQTRTHVEIETIDGAKASVEHDAGIAAPDVGEQGRRLREKFTSLVEPLYGAARTRVIIGLVDRLDSLANIGELTAACAAETAMTAAH